MTLLFRETVTLLNRRVAEDGDGLDVWKKTVLTGCVFVKTTVRSVSGSDVSLGQTVTVRIPESPDYHPYQEWKGSMIGFTASVGDIVVHGKVKEAVTPDNVRAVADKYESMTVRSVRDNTRLPLGHIHLEGV
nr:MAG TPA_asm: hypothetical protein [Caudoviricetes sp.]